MSTETTKKNVTQTPFFSLLNDAEKIQIKEMRPDNGTQVITSIQKALKQFEKSEDWDDRSFFVQIKTPKHLKQKTEVNISQNQSREALLLHASTLITFKDYFLARNIYSFLLKKNIRDKESLLGLGICLFRLKELPAAKKCFNACNELFKMNQAKVWMGICLSEELMDDQAIQYFNSVTNVGELDADLHFAFLKAMGNSKTRLGDWKEASEHYERALSLVPNSDAVHVNLGTLEFQKKNTEVAFIHFKKAQELNPQNARAYCGMGLLYLENTNTAAAEREFAKALDIEPGNIVALMELIQLADQSNHYGKVKVRLVKWLLKEPKNFEVRYLLATCHFKERDYFTAEREVDFILKLNPKHNKANKLKKELHQFIHYQGATR